MSRSFADFRTGGLFSGFWTEVSCLVLLPTSVPELCFLYFTLPAFFLRGFFFSLKISHYPYPARQYTDKRTRHLRYYNI